MSYNMQSSTKYLPNITFTWSLKSNESDIIPAIFVEEQQDWEQASQRPQQQEEQHGHEPAQLQQPDRQPGHGQRRGADRRQEAEGEGAGDEEGGRAQTADAAA